MCEAASGVAAVFRGCLSQGESDGMDSDGKESDAMESDEGMEVQREDPWQPGETPRSYSAWHVGLIERVKEKAGDVATMQRACQ